MHLVEVGSDTAPLTLHLGGYGSPLLPYLKYRGRIPVEAIANALELPKPTELTFIEWTPWARVWGALIAGSDSCLWIAHLLEVASKTEDALKTWEACKALVRSEDCDDQRFAASWLTLVAGAKDNSELEDWDGKFSPQLTTLVRRLRKYAKIEWPLVRILRGDPLSIAPIGDVCFIDAVRFGYGTDLEALAKKWDQAGAVVALYGSQRMESLEWPCEEVKKNGYLLYNHKFSLS